MREINADFAIALGGGSPMDCCKAACAIAKGDGKIRSYHSEGKAINKDEAIPMIAVTTTSGTASEVTNISVLTDVEKNLMTFQRHRSFRLRDSITIHYSFLNLSMACFILWSDN